MMENKINDLCDAILQLLSFAPNMRVDLVIIDLIPGNFYSLFIPFILLILCVRLLTYYSPSPLLLSTSLCQHPHPQQRQRSPVSHAEATTRWYCPHTHPRQHPLVLRGRASSIDVSSGPFDPSFSHFCPGGRPTCPLSYRAFFGDSDGR